MASSQALQFQRGIDDYRAGRHYEAHEHWEELWHEEENDDRRRFLQALIQVASAVHKAVNDVAPRGSLRLFDAAIEKLEGLADDYLGLDLVVLRREVGLCRAEIERQLSESGHCRLDAAHIPNMVQLADAPTFVAGQRDPTVPARARQAWFERGLAAYAAGEYFDAHELWEEIWRDTPAGFDRHFIQGLIQVAAAMHKVCEHHKPKPAARLLTRALDKLVDAPADYRGLDVTRLLVEGRAAKVALETTGVIETVPTIARRALPPG